MSLFKKISIGLKAAVQLAPGQIINYLRYQAGLRSGYYRLRTPLASINQLIPDEAFVPNWFMHLPDKEAFSLFGENYQLQIIKEADEIVKGNVRLFGADPVPLTLTPPDNQTHWTLHETGKVKAFTEDIKFIWEPARFGWALALGKAYFFSNDANYSKAFLRYLEEFNQSNPLNRGPNWQSGQEVALRLITQIIVLHLFKSSTSFDKERIKTILMGIADHAERILPTIAYAKAQNNNHLISEAAGLFSAGVFLPKHPRSGSWKETGLKTFNEAIEKQINSDGEYIQHSTNYHRMLLMFSLWMQYLLNSEGKDFESLINKKLSIAVNWLAGQMDYISGKVPNLGHNDGTNILFFTNSSYMDYRPVIQASSRAFLAKAALPAGNWDDLCVWLGLPVTPVLPESIDLRKTWLINRIGTTESWASMRAVQYTNRPAHADQLHVEIWHQGVNVACDAGTYLYNANPPWDNKLSSTLIHNTVSINSQDQMTLAGRFLWLDWAKAKIVSYNPNSINGIHDGYLKSGVIHKRKMENQAEKGWLITDRLVQLNGKKLRRYIQLNWLLPDWPYELYENTITLNTPFGLLRLELFTRAGIIADGLNIIHGGKSLNKKEDSINHGWYSPTYGVKYPALSVQYCVTGLLPIEITTQFSFMG